MPAVATVLANALRRPLTGKAHRPRRLHVRGHPQWKELFPHLDELGIQVAVRREHPKVQRAYRGYLRRRQQGRSALDFLSQLLLGTPVALAVPP